MGLVLFALKSIIRRGHQNLLATIILSFGLFIFFVGNAILDSGTAGLARVYKDALIGDAAIGQNDSQPVSIWGYEELFSTQFSQIPVLEKADYLAKQLANTPGIASVCPVVASAIFLETGSYRSPVYMLGTSAAKFFPSRKFNFVFGAGPQNDDRPWIIINHTIATHILIYSGHYPVAGDIMQLTFANANGFVIRGIPLAGVVDFPVHNSGMDSLCIVDLPSAWELLGMKPAIQNAPPAHTTSTDPDDLFAGDLSDAIPDAGSTKTWNSSDIANLLSANPNANSRPLTGSINFQLLQFKPGYDFTALSRAFKPYLASSSAHMMDWEAAAGQSLRYVVSIQQIFNGGMLLFSVLIIMIFINTVGNSIVERRGEIGVLRALGARRGKVSLVFIIEYVCIGLVSLLVAIVVGGVVVLMINSAGIHINNEVLVNLFGGSVLRAFIHPELVVKGLFLAVLLPLLVVVLMSARLASITPQQAMQNGS